ncbi:MAG TPA: hypothetical protein PKC30_11615 [Saprospiraceae bacterium]|nr:hypothetical protein [Saprospiraceae bacterium]
MRIVFLIIVFVHALIHLLGFVKGFGIREVGELTVPVSKFMGIIGLTSTILFLTYGVSFLLHFKYTWLLGIIAVVISQLLIITYWQDARFGTIPNMLIFSVSIFSLGYFNFQMLVRQETNELHKQLAISEDRNFSDNELTELPEPVGNWLRNSGAVGKPLLNFGKITQIAEMQMKPGQDKWLKATATQHTTIDPPAFIWTVNVIFNHILFFAGRDKFENGKGEMLIKLNSLINIVNAHGEKIDEGSLQRYLGEMAWFPSLALSPYITWQRIDHSTAKATMTYKGTTGSGIFHFTPEGDVLKFSALRFKGNEANAKCYHWDMDVLDYKSFQGIKVPAKMTSTWKLDDGDWVWLKLEVIDIMYNQSENN